MMLETHMKLCVTEADFPEKKNFPQKLGKWAKKKGFLNMLKNSVVNFY